jgi:ABC-type Zn uptake system ZnuABC Zn-binding protein ZnuA
MLRIALLALMVCSLGAAGCSPQASRSKNGKPVAVATLTMIADMVAQVGGDRIEVRCIMKPGNDPHIYRPVPGDLKMIAESDIVFINGLTIEGWITDLIGNAPGKRPVVTVTDGVEAFRSEQFHGEPDPHCWFDVKNAIIYVNNIEKGLAAMDPSGADYYRQRADAYREELSALDDWVRAELLKVPAEKRKLVTSHDAFHYFGKAYGFEVLAVQGVSTESQPNSADVINLIKEIRDTKVAAVFVETSVNPKTLQHVAKESGARVGGELFSDSCGDPGTPEGTYVGMVRHNVKTIVEALTK